MLSTCPRTTPASAAPLLASPFARPPALPLVGTKGKYECHDTRRKNRDCLTGGFRPHREGAFRKERSVERGRSTAT